MSKVYFTDFEGSPGNSVMNKLKKLCGRAGLGEIIKENDLVALKMHFGELGNTRMLRPQFITSLVELIKSYKGAPFLTDCNTLFYRNRYNGVCHLETAGYNGFHQSVVGAPVIIADGLRGLDYRIVSFNGEKVKVGSAIYEADKIITVTHFKGHEDTGFGGIIKNLGVGAVARPYKQTIHSHVKPSIEQEQCRSCGTCRENCPEKAINCDGKKPVIIQEQCNNCGLCLVNCPNRVIPIQWERDDLEMIKKMVNAFGAVLSNKQNGAFFVSFLVDITAICDCRSWSPTPLVGDLGILAGNDPVAVEKASLDLVESAVRKIYNDKCLKDFTGKNGLYQIEYAEKLGLGSSEYELIHL
ncbi:DUF362 domain-containing protein [Candidatus Contubernalis alkaliaceticus]|uniref:DUF362 domain-containing protein n=1 Tax=Candidatus Contubernalis alkaliaceticus TaxID=338645 RepID=UPI001F4BEE56|nr:DUF362 domain-containing protein [Candidatus Contubernalis alkalaceticus]UNC90871.1 DUF362 domain-containing protein [Candidatus Contubernalis alkalaceticus]